jgi:hypothetical protein
LGSFTGSFTGSVQATYLTASGLNYPTVDGLEGQTVQTDGNGNLFFNDIETIYESIKNGETFTLVKGTPVYVSGSQGANPIVYAADAANPAKMPVIYIVAEDLATNTVGRGILLGLITGINLTGYTAGADVFVAPGGGWTATRPTGSVIIQLLGIVTKPGNGGQGIVLNPGPATLPNIQPGYVWVGDSNSYPTAVATSSIQNVISSSYALNADLLDGKNSSEFATTGSNIFTGTQYVSATDNAISFTSTASIYTDGGARITKDLFVSGTTYLNNLTVYGSASVTFITSSTLVGLEFIDLNTDLPALRYAGINVQDSGSSTGLTASFWYDSETNDWIFVQTPTLGAPPTSSVTIFGPISTLGNQKGIIGNYLTKGELLGGSEDHDHHITSSQIYDDGVTVAIAGNLQVTGSLYAGSLTGSLFGTASYAISASQAISASYANVATSASYAFAATSASYAFAATSASYALSASHAPSALTASYAISASQAITASYANDATSASYAFNATSASYAVSASHAPSALTASYAISASQAITASYANVATSASYANVATSASYAFAATSASYANAATSASYAAVSTSGSYAATSSFANDFTVAGTLTAQTIVVQTITSSVSYVTGSTIFGSQLSNTHQFTGSVTITGSLAVNGSNAILTNQTSSMTVLSSSYALTASFAQNVHPDVTASYAISASQAVTASYSVSASQATTASYANVATSASYAFNSTSGSYAFNATSASYSNNSTSASYAFNSTSASYAFNSTTSSYANVATSASYANNATSASYANNATTSSYANDATSASYAFAATSASYALTASYASNVPITASYAISASQATTSSYANDATSASYALTASYASNVPVTASYAISSSQAETSSFAITASYSLNVPVTASYALSASQAVTASFALNAGGGAGFPFSGSAVITGSFLVTQSFVDFTSASYVLANVTGSLFGTASYATFALSASNAPGFTTNMSQSVAAATWSFNHNLNTRNPIVQVYDTNYQQIVPNEIVGVNAFLTEIRFTYAQAGYAVASNGGGLYVTGSTPRLIQSVAATTWSFAHKLGTKYPGYEVYDSNDNVIIPAGIKSIDTNNAEIYFAFPTTGVAIANFSGISGSLDNAISASYAVSASYALNATTAATASYFLTSSVTSASFATTASYALVATSSSFASTSTSASYALVATTASFALTATSASFALTATTASFALNATSASFASTATSASFATSAVTSSYSDNLIVKSTLTFASTLNDYATVASSIVGTNNLFAQVTGSYTSAFMKYTVKNGANSRTGEIMVVWNGASVEYTDVSTNDIGNTSAVTMSAALASSDIQLNAVTNTSGWSIKSLATFM